MVNTTKGPNTKGSKYYLKQLMTKTFNTHPSSSIHTNKRKLMISLLQFKLHDNKKLS